MKEIERKIFEAKNVQEMDALRMEVVKSKDNAVLKMWQTKYWRLKEYQGG